MKSKTSEHFYFCFSFFFLKFQFEITVLFVLIFRTRYYSLIKNTSIVTSKSSSHLVSVSVFITKALFDRHDWSLFFIVGTACTFVSELSSNDFAVRCLGTRPDLSVHAFVVDPIFTCSPALSNIKARWASIWRVTVASSIAWHQFCQSSRSRSCRVSLSSHRSRIPVDNWINESAIHCGRASRRLSSGRGLQSPIAIKLSAAVSTA